ncbi:ABC transporter ATP-binding protein [Enterovirga sp. DB1703]|uniref:ABC transporter ATP-binding protein n=1 Tax=Enterovirga aerilata TaxID=2730920 RepID=A0A849IKN1_9HYPH|nr:ABC transporter ATP-binding protein [Enterovirga sp. DB1703]NNM74503.1 ABC transporter ATP-binding protein [Enterovirga sp. DB1703]
MPALRIRGVTKRFGPLVANEAVDLDLARGEILALLGENGAGKTTLMNILFGHYVADEGTIEVADEAGALRPLPAGSPGAALAAGIGMVHQHFALAESLSVIENVVLGTRPLLAPGLGLRAARRRLDTLMRDSGLRVDPNRRVGALGVGEKQRVEILKVLHRGARILVLDEPTAVLAPQEAEQLFGILRRLRGQGLSVIFISHKLGEVAALADRVAVLRAGRKVADQPVAGADKTALAALMVGREVVPSRRVPQAPGPALLVLDRVSVPGERGRPGLVEASLTIHGGEILGIAGVSGNGQAELAGLLAGMKTSSVGTVRLAGQAIPPGPAGAVASGIGRIPEDRHRDGAVGSLGVAENLALETLSSPDVQRWGFLRFGRMRETASRAISAYDIRCPGPEAPVRLLSGGNMQKVILARAFESHPRLVLADQPTRGLDVGAAGEVHRRLLEARNRGAGILLISEDLDELLAISDRIAVMAGGRLSEPQAVENVTLAELGLKMAASGTGQDRAAA